MTRTVVVYPDAQAVADVTAARLLITLGDTLALKERADVVVTGGSVGIATLAAVPASPLSRSVDWSRVHVWWGDERVVPHGDPDRNEGQAQEALLSHVPLPESNIHRVGSADDGSSAQSAAEAYQEEISAAGAPQWDVLMLGLGPDGHVASLFPGHPAFTDPGADVLPVDDSPKPPPSRVSLALSTINRAKQVWIMAAGDTKAEAVRLCLEGDTHYPGAAVAGSQRTLWLLDVAAAGEAHTPSRE
ncbi:MAG: 6-phosphogluconolactonase [Demequina sp.]